MYMHHPLDFIILNSQTMCVFSISLSMYLNKPIVNGISDSLIISLRWDSITTFLITHYLFIIMTLKFHIFFYIWMALSLLLHPTPFVIISCPNCEFAIEDMGPLSYFLSICVTRHLGGIFLFQQIYPYKIIQCASIFTCNPSPTLVNTNEKLSGSLGKPYYDPIKYRDFVGALHHLTFTRLDIPY